jgi:hypothetical protein
MIKVTFEFDSVDAAIVGLGKLVGAPVAAKQPRKGRDDKGQPRGTYKPRAIEPAAPDTVVSAGQTPTAAVVAPTPGQAVAAAHKAEVAEQPAPAVASPSDVVKAEIQAQQKTQGTGFPEPTIGEKDVEVAAAVNAIYGKVGIDPVKKLLADFGIGLLRNLPKSKKADFLAAAQKIVA